METADLLRAALSEIEDPRDWCQGAMFTYDCDGRERRCALGAIVSVRAPNLALLGLENVMPESVTPAEVVAYEALNRVSQRRAGVRVPEYNDTHSHAEVVSLFQEAYREVKAAEASPLGRLEEVYL